MIARACSLHELQPELLAVALDPADDPSIRAHAVSALETCGDDASKAPLLPLASVHPETLSFWNHWLNSDFWEEGPGGFG
jgi:hypothetical protein